MNADAAFITGKSHRVCQDYARADVKAGQYVIVSDGCSSSADSDFGARLLVKSVENAILDPSTADPMGEMTYVRPPLAKPANSIVSAQTAARVLHLSEYALDATLLLVQYRETTTKTDEQPEPDAAKSLQVSAYGDGVIAARRRESGIIEGHRIEYPSGYPQYLNYRLNAGRQARMTELFKTNPHTVAAYFIEKNGESTLDAEITYGEDHHLLFFPVEQYDMVAVFSDGVTAVTDGNMVVIPWQRVVAEMMDVPLPKGEFVQRQMNWLVKEAQKRKWTFADDFSMGAISLGVTNAEAES